jgi:hypothetical protein
MASRAARSGPLSDTPTAAAGPLHPELQLARCMSYRYKAEQFPRCVACTRRWAGDTCRFLGIRFFLRDARGAIVGASYVDDQRPDGPTMRFPTRWNGALDRQAVARIKVRAELFLCACGTAKKRHHGRRRSRTRARQRMFHRIPVMLTLGP